MTITFCDKMLIEPLDRIKILQVNGMQTKTYVNIGYNVINIETSTYCKIEKIACGLKPSGSGYLRSKPEGVFLTDERDLFKDKDSILVLRDTLVSGMVYKRYQVSAIDPATKKIYLQLPL